MKSKIRIFIILSTVVMMMAAGTVTVQASAKSDALKAYKEFTAQNVVQRNARGAITNSTTSITRFSVIYLDNNSVPELLVEHGGLYYSPYVYTYKNGRILSVDGAMIAASAQIKGYYKKKGCLVLQEEGNGYPYHLFQEVYCSYKSNKLIPKLEKTYTGTEKKVVSGPNYFYTNGSKVQQNVNKKTTKSAFNSKLKKMVGSKKLTKVKMLENTEANREKAFK